MDERDLSYALAKKVPDMERGFVIGTCYGPIDIPPGPLATRIRQHLERVLSDELVRVVMVNRGQQ